jgi:hypothetical protein
VSSATSPVPRGGSSSQPTAGRVFISYAYEDRRFAWRLARELGRLGVPVWLDQTEMSVGESIRERIDRGVRSSRFGVVILSASYFQKGWTRYELDGLLAKNEGGRKAIFPVWHRVTKEEVVSFSPGLAGLKAVRTSLGVKEVACQIRMACWKRSMDGKVHDHIWVRERHRSLLSEPPAFTPAIGPSSLPRGRWRDVAGLRRLAVAVAMALTITLLGARSLSEVPGFDSGRRLPKLSHCASLGLVLERESQFEDLMRSCDSL